MQQTSVSRSFTVTTVHDGANGVDAQDIEWVYIRTKKNVAPVIYSDSNYTDSNSKTYTADDHLPRVSGSGRTDIETNGGSSSYPQCTDDPKGVTSEWQYEWEIKREKGTANANGHRSWMAYSGTMTLHNNYAASLLEIDIDNDNDQFGTDSTGKVIDAQSRTTNVTMYYGAEQQAFLSAPTIALKYEDGTSVPAAVAAATIAVVSGTSNKQYLVTVSVKATGTGSTVFGTSGHSGLYVDISGTCSYGTKSIRFTLEKLMSGAQGVSPTIYQLDLSQKVLTYSRDASNNLVAQSNSVTVGVKRTVGNQTDHLTLAASGLTCTWGYDGTYTTNALSTSNPTITVAAGSVGSHTRVSIQLSTGDKENVTIVKDGTNGAKGDSFSGTCNPGSISVNCSNDGKVATAVNKSLTFSLSRNGTATPAPTVTVKSKPAGVTIQTHADVSAIPEGYASLSISAGTSMTTLDTGVVFTLTYSDFSAECVLPIVCSKNGDDSIFYTLQCSPSVVNFRSDATGSFSQNATKRVECVVNKAIGNSNEAVSVDDRGRYDNMYLVRRGIYADGTYQVWLQRDFYSVTAQMAIDNNVVGVEFVLAKSVNGNYEPSDAVVSVTVPIICDGRRGSVGATGKMFYPMGNYDPDVRYVLDEEKLLVPMVYYPRSNGVINTAIGVAGDYWYLKKSMPESGYVNLEPSTSSYYWERADGFGVVITQGIFAEFAKLGKGIFSGDYLFSMNGYIGETSYIAGALKDGVPAYTFFDPLHPNGTGSSELLTQSKTLSKVERQGVDAEYEVLTDKFPFFSEGIYKVRIKVRVSNQYYRVHFALYSQAVSYASYIGNTANAYDTWLQSDVFSSMAKDSNYEVTGILTYEGPISSWGTPTTTFYTPSVDQFVVWGYFTSYPSKPSATSVSNIQKNTQQGVWSIDRPSSGSGTLYACYGTKTYPNGYAYVSSVIIESQNVASFVPNWWVNLMSGKMSAAKGNFVVDANGDVHVKSGDVDISGTIRAKNLYHGICIVGQEEYGYCNQSFLNTYSGEDWIGNFTLGNYYTEAQARALSNGDVGISGMRECTYDADIVITPNLYNNSNRRYVYLPCAKDFEGKIVEVLDNAYTNGQTMGSIEVRAVDGGDFGSGIWSSEVQRLNDNAVIGAGRSARFYSIYSNRKWYWLKLSNI